jgi:hypothetical protein
MPLSERQMERAQIDSDTYELDWIQSVLRTAIDTMETATKHSRSDLAAAYMDRLSDMIGEIDHELETLGRS